MHKWLPKTFGCLKTNRFQYNIFGIKHKIIDPIPIEKLFNGENSDSSKAAQ